MQSSLGCCVRVEVSSILYLVLVLVLMLVLNALQTNLSVACEVRASIPVWTQVSPVRHLLVIPIVTSSLRGKGIRQG